MKWNEAPKPLIEEHYHIQELIEGQEKRSSERTYWKNQKKVEEEFFKDLQGFKDIELLDFYCTKCNKDFKGRAKRQLDNWSKIAYYKIKHTCGTWNIRHITDRVRDPYFFYSRQIARDRGEHYADALQSFETGFNMLYGKQKRG